MPDTPNTSPGVARGDRRNKVWIEADEHQLSKVRHTFPGQGAAVEEQSEASEDGVTAEDITVSDVAIAPDDASAWEALEAED
jgi:hypothetical protein